MPTPVGVARECLTSEAAQVLDEAVSVARRRGHSQTTSLHAISALLLLPSSILRDACARARNSAYSPRLQFKALELCLSVSLDRVPSTQLTDDPPVSNSLMAAIKRSQANQRRQPDNFHLYQQISQQTSSVSCVKVELQHLILSILDDPVVSRVLGEAGFRSSEIKLAIVRPLPQLLKYSRSRNAPVFTCNLTENMDSGRRSFSFPFSGSSGFCVGDDNYRRIGDVLSRSRGRNPLLLGTCAYDALRNFMEAVDKRKEGVLPVELSGLRVICIGKDVSKFTIENCDNETMSSRFKEIAQMVEPCVGPGLVVNFGDLKSLVDESASGEAVSYIVAQLAKLLELNYGKFWLMGAAASYESYLKFVGKFPSIEEDWDLQLLPITSSRSSKGESYLRPRSSLMDSFVPFGGFFSSPSDVKGPLSGSRYCVPHCHQCSERCDQEVLAASKERFSASAADPNQCNLPPWLLIAELGKGKGLNIKTKDDGILLDTSESGRLKKLDKTCQHLHHTQQFPEEITCSIVVSSQCSDDNKEDVDNHSSKITDASPSEYIDLNSCMPIGVQMISTSQSSCLLPEVSMPREENNTLKVSEMFQKVEDLESGDLRSCIMSNSTVCDGSQLSPTSVTSVTTDPGIGICSSPTSNKSKKPTSKHTIECPKEIASPFCLNFDLVNKDIFKHPAQSSSSSEYSGPFDLRNPKALFEALAKKVSWQDEALHSIIKTIAYWEVKRGKHQGVNQRRDIWMNFVGPDRHGKKKIAVSLAEILYGTRERFILVDLNSEEIKVHDVKFRGKTVLDFLVGELFKNPLSVVFLENVDKADMLTQNSLSQAIKTGKLTDSHGREVGVNNAIFVTSFLVERNKITPTREPSSYSEDRILSTKGVAIKIKVEHVIGDIRSQSHTVVNSSTEGIPNLIFVKKRKLGGDNDFHDQHKISDKAKRAHQTSNWLLDLNVPAEENELQHVDNENSEGVSTENQNPWLQDLYKQVDETILFKPYNFDALADRVLKVIRKSFHKILGSECSLQIESEVMEQLLAAAYVADGDIELEDWVELVLSEGFTEIQRRYSLTAHSIVKLATCQEKTTGVYLPPRITID